MAQHLGIAITVWLFAVSTAFATPADNISTDKPSNYNASPSVSIPASQPHSIASDRLQTILSQALEQAHSTELAASPQWHKLIHLTKNKELEWRTDIKTEEFYFSDINQLDPHTEMQETLRAFFQTDTSLGDAHAQCRFPARLLWLRTHLPKIKSLPMQPCGQLQEWITPLIDQPINIVHVSGFFGNPASAFGHLLLRIGESNKSGSRGLLNTGINFGARIPPTENSIMYIVKGLFGGYSASFTDKHHYLQDHVYASVEARDMWAYELALTTAQQSLMINHLWELRGIEFSYYFLRTNCAYRIAELLELVLESPFLPQIQPYYLPADVFYKLDDLNRKRDGKLLRNIRFIASQKRHSLNSYQSLPPQNAEMANQVLAAYSLKNLEQPPNSALVNFLIGYTDYLLATSKPDESVKLLRLKDELLIERLTRPSTPPDHSTSATPTDPATTVQWPGASIPDATAPPGLGLRARVLRLGFAQGNNGENWQEVSLSPFSFDLLDTNRGSLVDSSFRVLEVSVDNRDSDNSVRVRNLDVLAFEKYSNPNLKLAGEQPLAWSGRLSLQRPVDCTQNCTRAVLSAGLGRSIEKGRMLWYGLISGDLQLNPGAFRVGISAGGIWRQSSHLRGIWKTNWNRKTKDTNSRTKHELTLRYRPLRDHAFDASIINDYSTTYLRAGYSYRW